MHNTAQGPVYEMTYNSTIPHHLVTLLLKLTAFEISDFENCRDLEIRVKGHSMSLKVVPLDRLSIVSC